MRAVLKVAIALAVLVLIYSVLPRGGRDTVNRFAVGAGLRVTPWEDRAATSLRSILEDPETRRKIGESIINLGHPTGSFQELQSWDVRNDGSTLVAVLRVNWKGGFVGTPYTTAMEWRFNRQRSLGATIPLDTAASPLPTSGNPKLDGYLQTVLWPAVLRATGE